MIIFTLLTYVGLFIFEGLPTTLVCCGIIAQVGNQSLQCRYRYMTLRHFCWCGRTDLLLYATTSVLLIICWLLIGRGFYTYGPPLMLCRDLCFGPTTIIPTFLKGYFFLSRYMSFFDSYCIFFAFILPYFAFFKILFKLFLLTIFSFSLPCLLFFFFCSKEHFSILFVQYLGVTAGIEPAT